MEKVVVVSRSKRNHQLTQEAMSGVLVSREVAEDQVLLAGGPSATISLPTRSLR